jgi:hypothetical protein
MTPERVAELVTRWVRFYTRGLPAPIAQRRREEIGADVHDQIAHDRAAGTSERRIARAIASRAVRGLAADVAWQRRHATGTSPLRRPAVRVALGVAAVLALPLVGMLLSQDVAWSLADFVAAGVLLTIVGVAFELAVKRAGNLATAIALAVLGVAAGVFGNADDAPGLVLLGLLLVAGGIALGVRSLQRAR